MSKVFISYSSSNKDFVRELASDLTDLGHQTWFNEKEIHVGDCIATKIELGILEADFVIVALSQQAVKSGWVEKEWKSKYWDEINQDKISVLPVLINDCDIPPLLKTKRFADFRKNYATGLVNLINAINQVASIPPSHRGIALVIAASPRIFQVERQMLSANE